MKCVILFTVTLVFPFLSLYMLKYAAVPQLSRWGKSPKGRLVFVASLKLSPDFFFFFLEKSILCAIFLYLFRALHPAEGGIQTQSFGGEG